MKNILTAIGGMLAPAIVTGKKKSRKIVLLDNGHAKNTPGKRSPKLPDGTQFFEWEFNRDIVNRINAELKVRGIECHVLVPETDVDVPLSTRAYRANIYCDRYGADNCIFVSVHANAAGNGGWMQARGWSIYTTKGKTKSDDYATIFWEEANKLLPKKGQKMRADRSDGDPDYEENFTVIYKTKCPAVLTENLFYDNKEDLAFLMSEEGKQTIAQIHINAIMRICNE